MKEIQQCLDTERESMFDKRAFCSDGKGTEVCDGDDDGDGDWLGP